MSLTPCYKQGYNTKSDFHTIVNDLSLFGLVVSYGKINEIV